MVRNDIGLGISHPATYKQSSTVRCDPWEELRYCQYLFRPRKKNPMNSELALSAPGVILTAQANHSYSPHSFPDCRMRNDCFRLLISRRSFASTSPIVNFSMVPGAFGCSPLRLAEGQGVVVIGRPLAPYECTSRPYVCTTTATA